MNIFTITSLIRAATYLWVSLTSFSIAQLYEDGYDFAGKDSAIIRSLIKILNQIFVVFFILSLVAVENIFSQNFKSIVAMFLPIAVFPLGLFLTKFRKESVKKQ